MRLMFVVYCCLIYSDCLIAAEKVVYCLSNPLHPHTQTSILFLQSQQISTWFSDNDGGNTYLSSAKKMKYGGKWANREEKVFFFFL